MNLPGSFSYGPAIAIRRGIEMLKSAMAAVPYGDSKRADVLTDPVISAKQRDGVIPFEDTAAVRIAYDSAFGLAGGGFSASLERSFTVAHRIRASVLSVNGGTPYTADLPFGGYEPSSIARQNETAGYEQYLRTKSPASPARAHTS